MLTLNPSSRVVRVSFCMLPVLALVATLLQTTASAAPNAPSVLELCKSNGNTRECVSASTAPASPSRSSGSIVKWNPGHYLGAFGSRLNFSVTPPRGTPTLIKGNEHFVGVLLEYKWSELEPAEGVYDFSDIFQHLNEFRKWSPKPVVVVNLLYRDFRYDRETSSLPGYIWDQKDPEYGSNIVVTEQDNSDIQPARGVVPVYWRTGVKRALKNMLTAMSKATNPVTGQTLDDDPLFAGLHFLDLPPGFTRETVPPDLDSNSVPPEQNNLVQAYLEYVLHAKSRFPNTLIFQSASWLLSSEEYVQYIVDQAKEHAFAISGPDLSSPGHTTNGEKAVYPGLLGSRDYRGEIALARMNQVSGYLRTSLCNGLTVDDIFKWSVDDDQGPRLNYIFWSRLNKVNFCDKGWSWNSSELSPERRIKDVVSKNEARINSRVPRSLK